MRDNPVGHLRNTFKSAQTRFNRLVIFFKQSFTKSDHGAATDRNREALCHSEKKNNAG